MIELTPETIDTVVMKAPLPVAVFFTSPHCGPCRFVYPLLEALVPEYADRLTIVKAQIEAVDQWRKELNIMSIPRMVIFKGGKEVKRIDPRNKGDMRLEFDAVAANTGSGQAADQAALKVYQSAVEAAKVALASSHEEIGGWWSSIVGEAAEASDAAWEPLNDAAHAEAVNDASYQSLSEEAQQWAWIYKREALKGEERFAEVMARISIAEAAFEAVAKPHAEERSRRYAEAELAYETAIEAARLAYKEKTGSWPAGDLQPSA